MNTGILYALVTYLLWALFPIYWKQLKVIPAVQVLGHRIVWSFVFLMLVIIFSGKLKAFLKKLDMPTLKAHALAALCLAINWLIYVWAVNSGYVIESSLGYFINPLLSVFFGVIFLKEKLRSMQWVPIGVAGLGVLYLTIVYGRLPWIALSLATSFGLYGLLKKKSSLGSLYGLALETGVLFFPALGYVLWLASHGAGLFVHTNTRESLYLLGAGAVTSIPLLLFAKAAQRIPLTTIGLMQYITPTGQFLLGVLLYEEPFSPSQAIGFSIVWLALLIFATESWIVSRRKYQPAKTQV